MCSESRKNGHEDGCTQQEECSGAEGKQQGCYVLWNDDNGTISVKLKGCFLHDECNNTKCIDTNNKRNNEYLYCCCKGNMCNTNFSWEPKPIPTEKEPPVVKGIIISIKYQVYNKQIWFIFQNQNPYQVSIGLYHFVQ